ncbi:hypothetical protein [Kitasatospora sp. NPDC004272]
MSTPAITTTAAAPAAPPVSADPRVGPLLDLVQSLFAALSDVGTNFSAAIPDPVTRRKVLTHAEDNTRLCRDRLNTLLAKTP